MRTGIQPWRARLHGHHKRVNATWSQYDVFIQRRTASVPVHIICTSHPPSPMRIKALRCGL